jgi:hypothetical protein
VLEDRPEFARKRDVGRLISGEIAILSRWRDGIETRTPYHYYAGLLRGMTLRFPIKVGPYSQGTCEEGIRMDRCQSFPALLWSAFPHWRW